MSDSLSRRRLIGGLSALVTTGVAGCLSTESNPQTNRDEVNEKQTVDSDGTGSPETSATVTELRYPEPELIAIEHETLDADTHQFHVTVTNTGKDGFVGIDLTRTSDDGSEPESIRNQVDHFNNGETGTIMIDVAAADATTDPGVRLSGKEAQAIVENQGEAGRFNVELLLPTADESDNTAYLLADEKLSIRRNDTRIVNFNGYLTIPNGSDVVTKVTRIE